MFYTDEEKKKITKSRDEIVKWIDESIGNRTLHKYIFVQYGGDIGNGTMRYILTICNDKNKHISIRRNSDGVCLHLRDDLDGSTSSNRYEHDAKYNFVHCLMNSWEDVKNEIMNSITKDSEFHNSIMNFSV